MREARRVVGRRYLSDHSIRLVLSAATDDQDHLNQDHKEEAIALTAA